MLKTNKNKSLSSIKMIVLLKITNPRTKNLQILLTLSKTRKEKKTTDLVLLRLLFQSNLFQTPIK